jgi:hypothetical protein
MNMDIAAHATLVQDGLCHGDSLVQACHAQMYEWLIEAVEVEAHDGFHNG